MTQEQAVPVTLETKYALAGMLSPDNIVVMPNHAKSAAEVYEGRN